MSLCDFGSILRAAMGSVWIAGRKGVLADVWKARIPRQNDGLPVRSGRAGCWSATSLQSFILEPILTPSGFLDGGDDLPELRLPESIDDSFEGMEQVEVDVLVADAPVELSVMEGELEGLSFITADEVEVNLATDLTTDFGENGAVTAVATATATGLRFESGVFTVGESGRIDIDFLFDGGAYRGELAVFSLTGMDGLDLDEPEGMGAFVREAAYRALQNEADSGYVVISDLNEGARFSGLLGEGRDWNSGDYGGIKTFEMNPGDEFGLMLVPKGTVKQVLRNPEMGGAARPLFSMATANPDDGFHLGQIADVYGTEQIFAMEDLRVDGRSDGDYNDLIFSVGGASSDIIDLDNLIDPADDWRRTDPLLDPIAPDPLPLDPDSGTAYKPGELLVKFSPNASDADLNSLVQAHGASHIERLIPFDPSSDSPLQRWHTLVFDTDTKLLQLRDDLAANPFVETSSLNYARELAAEPNDSDFPRLWGLHNTGHKFQQGGGQPDADIDAPEAWDYQTGSEDVVVAVIDTGIDYDHSDLAANMWSNPGEIPDDNLDNDGNGIIDDLYGFDFGNSIDANGDGDYLDPGDRNDANPHEEGYTKKYGHGTHVAGIIGAVGNNNIGVIGVSPTVSLMALNIHDRRNDALWLDDIARAINYAIAKDADIINTSFGGWGFSPLEWDAIHTANDAGVLVVAAAGNERDNNDNPDLAIYPASYILPNLVAVAATNHRDKLSHFSNYGAISVDLGAPGGGQENIYSTFPNNQYQWRQGTSMAAPHVAGAAALLLAQKPTLSPAGLKQILLETVDPLPDLQGKTVSGGRLNLHRALERTLINTAPTLSAIATLGQATEGEPFEISYADLAAAADEHDLDGDWLAFRIEQVLAGTLTKDGRAAIPGATTLARGESLTWTSDTPGQAQPAFTVVASDGQAVSDIAVQVNVNVANVNDPPIVTLQTADAIAAEGGNTGSFILRRTGSTRDPLTVNFEIAGIATHTRDYRLLDTRDGKLLRQSITIPAGASNTRIILSPIDDTVIEPGETAILRLTADSAYQLGQATRSTIVIRDNDTPPPPRILASSDFTSGTEGWVTAEYKTIDNTLGRKRHLPKRTRGGYLSQTDFSKSAGNNKNGWHWIAPSEFRGHKSAAYQGRLEFELRTDNKPDPDKRPKKPSPRGKVILRGRGLTLIHEFNRPGKSFTRYSIPLHELAGWKDKKTGRKATKQQIQTVLSNISDLWIRGEWGGGKDTGWLDNVKIWSA